MKRKVHLHTTDIIAPSVFTVTRRPRKARHAAKYKALRRPNYSLTPRFACYSDG